MRKRDMAVEIDRLRGEVSYLRGQVAELQKAPGSTVAHIESIVTTALRPLFPPTPVLPDPYSDTGPTDIPEDWTDQLAPRSLTHEEVQALEDEMNAWVPDE